LRAFWSREVVSQLLAGDLHEKQVTRLEPSRRMANL
jgi:hypothetical protein